MNDIVKGVLTILLMMGVLGYTIFNYMAGKTDTDMFVLSLALLSFCIVNLIRALVQTLRKR